MREDVLRDGGATRRSDGARGGWRGGKLLLSICQPAPSPKKQRINKGKERRETMLTSSPAGGSVGGVAWAEPHGAEGVGGVEGGGGAVAAPLSGLGGARGGAAGVVVICFR